MKYTDQYPEDEDRDGPWNAGFFHHLTNLHGWWPKNISLSQKDVIFILAACREDLKSHNFFTDLSPHPSDGTFMLMSLRIIINICMKQGRGVRVTGVSAAYTFKLNKNILSE
jgi:hypothetical protein